MKFLLGLLAFIFFFFLLGTLVVFYYVRKGINTFKKAARQSNQSASRRTMHTSDGVTIYDGRDPDVAQRKIFADNEGEYVDFTEEKNEEALIGVE